MGKCLLYSTSWQDSQDHVVVANWLRGAEKWWQFLAQDLSCFLPLAHQWHWLHHLSRIAGQWQLLHWQCHEITWWWSAVWCWNGATNLWTIKIKSLHMLWSQYKLATIRSSKFLRKQLPEFQISQIGILIFWLSRHRNFKKISNWNLWNQKWNRNSAYNGGPRNRNWKLEFPTKTTMGST